MPIVAWGYGQSATPLVSWGYGLFPLGDVNSPAYDISVLIERSGLGVLGVDLFVGMMPETPDFVISAYDTGGFTPNAKWLFEEPSVRIIVRGNSWDYDSVLTKLREIKDALLNSGDQIVDGSTYTQYHILGDYILLGNDELERTRASLNFRFARKLTKSALSYRERL